jgi:oxaloacetate decarboxylase alpha subunit
MHILEQEFDEIVAKKKIRLAANKIDDLMTYALFPHVSILFFENRDNPDFFEPKPQASDICVVPYHEEGTYTVSFKGNSYTVDVSAGGDITSMNAISAKTSTTSVTQTEITTEAPTTDGEPIGAPLSGTIWKVMVSVNQKVNEGDVLVILEAMKMETEIKAARSGIVTEVNVKENDTVTVGQTLISLA